MTSERWRRIEEIYHAAAVLNPAARDAFLAQSCVDDSELRREVEGLLGNDPSKGDFLLNHPAWESKIRELTETVLAPGAQLGPYVIEGTLGAGGMGQVFRGRDTRLGRAVAIKIANVEFNDRFEREARSISALNHPNVCTLYDVGPNYLVMELVEGETLSARLTKGTLPLDLTLRYGAQISDALAAAHALGIVHRDLKPGNIMIAKTGVKVLDFGLAKAPGDESLTGAFGVVGTPAYMAPEQRAGKPCDQRTDIFALGLILLEMAQGDRTAAPRTLQPPHFAHMVERCLAEDPDARWQSARDVKSELEWCLARPEKAASSRPRAALRLWAIGVAAAAIIALLVARPWQGSGGAQPHAVHLDISLPDEGAGSDPGRTNGPPAVSPNGETVVLQLGSRANSALWLRRLDSDRFERLLGTDGGVQPFWSPDGRQIAFFLDGKLKKMRLAGGSPETICDINPAEPRGGAWSSRGQILFGLNYRGLLRVSENGGEAVQVAGLDTSIQENSLRFPQFLEGGNRFIYFSRTLDPKYHAIYIDSLDQAGQGKRRRIIAADGAGLIGHDPYSKEDYLLFPKEDRLWAQLFNQRNGEVEGPKVAISDDVGQFTLSSTGTLVFRKASAELNSLGWYDRAGRLISTVGQKGDYWDIQLSPDGERCAVINHRSSSGLFWIDVIELARNVQMPFTDFTAIGHAPVWTRDSQALYFAIFGKDTNRVATKLLNAMSAATTIATSKERYQPRDLSPDGKTLLADQVVSNSRQILVSSPVSEIGWRPVTSTSGLTCKGQFSPDGRWISYQSDETGTLEIYLTDFPGMQQKKRISASGGMEARWSRDGKELYYLASNGDLMAVQIGSSPLNASKATALFKFHGRSDDLDAGFQYAPSTDGQRLLMVNGDVGGAARDLRVIFNWPEIAARK